jgi:DNA topoisomerase I
MNEMSSPALRETGLRYISAEGPGIRRVRRGKHFGYLDPAGREITGEAELMRIRAIGVPPAYEGVWICPDARGHLQAIAVDARGRRQYRYHKRWREMRDETKFDRMLDFASALPRIHKEIESNLRLPGLPREKVLAAVVRLLEETTIRIGNESYAKQNDSYGLTPLRNRHAKIQGGVVQLRFKGKSGVRHAVTLRDRSLAKIIRSCQDLPGQDLFEYVDETDTPHGISSSEVNDYIREISGGDFTAKDFRTWVGTVECALLLTHQQATESAQDRKRAIVDVIKAVAARLGNTPAIARKSYIHPRILTIYETNGTLGALPRASRSAGLQPHERLVMQLLKPRTSKRRGADHAQGA